MEAHLLVSERVITHKGGIATMGNNYSVRTYLSAVAILLGLMIVSGALTYIIPGGQYERIEIDGVQRIIEGSFTYTGTQGIPLSRFILAPFLLLLEPGSIVIIAILLFLLIIGGAIHLLNVSGTIEGIIQRIVQRFADRKYLLLAIVVLAFMALGAFMGVFEETVPLVPIIVALAVRLGWDELTGLGMSVLACGFGFAAAVTNPFTIGVAQQLAGVPLFSGFEYRAFIFLIVYGLLLWFLIRHARKVESTATTPVEPPTVSIVTERQRLAGKWFAWVTATMLVIVFVGTVMPDIGQFSLLIIALLFLVNGVGAALIVGITPYKVLGMFVAGAKAMSPAIVLVLMAASIRYIITVGGVIDTILHISVQTLVGLPQFGAVMAVYLLVLVLNFFIGSGSAKAFLVIAVIAPLLDALGISRQMGILAFQFGDGFSNVIYPTNAVLLLSLGFTNVSYGKWFRWTLPLQLLVLALTSAFLWIGILIGY